MKCNSAYPTNVDEMNLRTILEYKRRFKLLVGLSDHSMDTLAPAISVALGAKVIEKHISLTKNSIDGFFSLNPSEFSKMVAQIRETEKCLGTKSFEVSKNSKKNLFAKRSLYIVKDIKKGEKFSNENLKSIRPSYGINTRYLKDIIGKKSKKDISAGTRMQFKFY